MEDYITFNVLINLPILLFAFLIWKNKVKNFYHNSNTKQRIIIWVSSLLIAFVSLPLLLYIEYTRK